ncbi:hypothetical protein [Desulfobacula sp.]|uniref:Uncharacterized protein n=1 Tax=Candidatus Desulfatibia vada TaxID=2841696 RepID=A0A8J6P165_9BACT|nr:hypothetical protein [Candidatus Desulfatibia vada]MBL6996466.1 hypothetical protein [Desulfobacula sp.]
MGILSKLFRTDPDSVYKACIKIYEKAKRERPGKNERDYLKLVLLTKPPYDYQHDKVINLLLDKFSTIEALADYIADMSDSYNRDSQKYVWESRERNLKFVPKVKKRNEAFFREFWG